MKKKLVAIIVAAVVISAWPGNTLALSGSYNDMPAEQWAAEAAASAGSYGLMQGDDNGNFGFGNTITRAEFVTILNRMFGWEPVNPATPAFSDVGSGEWYYSSIETALHHNVIDGTGSFSPGAPITREEMAVMLVRALGYKELAESVASLGNSFTDVTGNEGYINIAKDIGMTKGTSDTTFSPAATAKREEAAAMLVRVYKKYTSKTDWVHGFYAISSYAQRELSKQMDAVSAGWSRLSYDTAQGAYLNTTSAANNEYSIPSGYENITSFFQANGTKTHLSVYMDSSTKAEGSGTDICSAILLDETQRTKAVNAIVNELTTSYQVIGYNPYSGVTIDFEGMKGGALKEAFNAFLSELDAALTPMGKTLYVTVPPATSDGYYFDAYDFKTIGKIADKVILMAHDYHETTLPENLLQSEYYKNTAVTPFPGVYYALKAITDENTGVEDLSKVALAISFSSVGWELENGKVINTQSVNPSPATIYSRLKGGAQMGYSKVYRNPYISYTTEEGKNYFVWYEDARSVSDKIGLARLFGINGVSLWRIGNIPNYTDEGIYYDVMDSIQ